MMRSQLDTADYWIKENYLNQLRVPSRRSGMKYVRLILNNYLSFENKENADFKALIDKISQEASVQRKSILTAVRRFIFKSWKDNSFRTYLAEMYGYDSDTPPASLEFIRLVCVNYEPIVSANYELFMRRANRIPRDNERTYFIRRLLKCPLSAAAETFNHLKSDVSTDV